MDKSIPKLCPEACLDNPPIQTVQTESGVVYERNCPIEYFLQSADPEVESLDEMTKDLEQVKWELNQLVLQGPPVEMDQIMSEPENQVLHKRVRSGDLLQIPSEETSSYVFLPQDEVEESMSSSFYNIWMLNLGFVVILTVCYQSKIKALIRDGMNRNADNPYSSRVPLMNGQELKLTTKYALGAGVGMLGIIILPHSINNNQRLRNTAVIPNSAVGIQLKAKSFTTSDSPPVMSTFFEPVEGGCCGMSEEGHRNLVNSWVSSWQSLGWNTKIYTAEHAKRHPKFVEVEQKLRDVGMSEYDQRCFWRWLAAAADNDPMGVWQSDYDTFPLTLTAEKGLELMKQKGFKSYTKHGPSLLHGDQSHWNKIVDAMIEHIRPDLDPRYQISDTVIIMYLLDHYNLADLGITVWEDLVYPGFPYNPGFVPTIDCYTARQFLAAHLSHESSETDYMVKHTYPKISGPKEAIVTRENVQYSSENRADAGLIMMQDFKRECMK
jgi:hypothetical protein